MILQFIDTTNIQVLFNNMESLKIEMNLNLLEVLRALKIKEID